MLIESESHANSPNQSGNRDCFIQEVLRRLARLLRRLRILTDIRLSKSHEVTGIRCLYVTRLLMILNGHL